MGGGACTHMYVTLHVCGYKCMQVHKEAESCYLESFLNILYITQWGKIPHLNTECTDKGLVELTSMAQVFPASTP